MRKEARPHLWSSRVAHNDGPGALGGLDGGGDGGAGVESLHNDDVTRV